MPRRSSRHDAVQAMTPQAIAELVARANASGRPREAPPSAEEIRLTTRGEIRAALRGLALRPAPKGVQ